MRFKHLVISALVTASLAGCMKTNDAVISSSGMSKAQASRLATTQEAALSEQAVALRHMTQDIIRKSTTRGMAIGAVAGCGLALVSASNAKNCVTAAVAGGAVGALAGHAQGKKQAVKRVELVSPSALVRSIAKANDKMEVVSQDLPNLLAQQDTDLAALNQQMAQGQITEAEFAHRFEVIKANRAQLAEALSLSAAQANEAHRNLQSAASQGQTGLDWHLHATKKLAREATSARSAISLL